MFELGEIKRNISMVEIQTTLEMRWQKKMVINNYVFILLIHNDLSSSCDHTLKILKFIYSGKATKVSQNLPLLWHFLTCKGHDTVVSLSAGDDVRPAEVK